MQPTCIATAMAFLGRMRIIFTFPLSFNILKCNIETHHHPVCMHELFYTLVKASINLKLKKSLRDELFILVYNILRGSGCYQKPKLSGLENCWSTAREDGSPVCTNEMKTIPQTPAYLGDNAPFSNAGCIWLHDSLITTLLYILPLPSGSLTFILLYLYHPSQLMNRGLSINSYATALAPLRVSLPTVHSWLGNNHLPFSFPTIIIIVDQNTHPRMARFYCYTIPETISQLLCVTFPNLDMAGCLSHVQLSRRLRE